jgi:hypothetical protein
MAKNRRNDPCWCGSGGKYKNCHLRRSDEPPLPFAAIASQARNAAAFRTCLHPDAGRDTCGKVISAHTIQRSRVLSAIADRENHVLTFYPPKPKLDGGLILQRRGWRQSSTFTAFCNKHDTEAFAPLEAVPFTGTKEQIFLTAYRATCWELHQKRRATLASPAVRRLIDRGQPVLVQQRIQSALAVQEAGFGKGLSELSQLKEQMDAALVSGEYDAFDTLELALEGALGIASTGVITPNQTMRGKHIQTLHDDSTLMQWLAFGLDIRDHRPVFLFCWDKAHDAPRAYLDEILALDPRARATFLVQFVFAHCENTYFSDAWWVGLSDAERRYLESLMANSNPYYYPPHYDLGRQDLAPWKSADAVPSSASA